MPRIADAVRHDGRVRASPSFRRGRSAFIGVIFSRSLPPQVEIGSGDTITIETLTQHASDDPELMIVGDAGAESVFRWTRDGERTSIGAAPARWMPAFSAAAPARGSACTSAPDRSR